MGTDWLEVIHLCVQYAAQHCPAPLYGNQRETQVTWPRVPIRTAMTSERWCMVVALTSLYLCLWLTMPSQSQSSPTRDSDSTQQRNHPSSDSKTDNWSATGSVNQLPVRCSSFHIIQRRKSKIYNNQHDARFVSWVPPVQHSLIRNCCRGYCQGWYNRMEIRYKFLESM